MARVNRGQIVDAARSWVGTRYRHQGRRKGAGRGGGVDCAGLILGVAWELDLLRVDYSHYARQPNADNLRRLLEAHGERLDTPLPGAVLLIVFDRHPQHLAIYTGSTLIHSYGKARGCVEHSFDLTWRRRLRGVYDYPGVQD